MVLMRDFAEFACGSLPHLSTLGQKTARMQSQSDTLDLEGLGINSHNSEIVGSWNVETMLKTIV